MCPRVLGLRLPGNSRLCGERMMELLLLYLFRIVPSFSSSWKRRKTRDFASGSDCILCSVFWALPSLAPLFVHA
ncbi:unnamed protein product [Ixodes pacificus]